MDVVKLNQYDLPVEVAMVQCYMRGRYVSLGYTVSCRALYTQCAGLRISSGISNSPLRVKKAFGSLLDAACTSVGPGAFEDASEF